MRRAVALAAAAVLLAGCATAATSAPAAAGNPTRVRTVTDWSGDDEGVRVVEVTVGERAVTCIESKDRYGGSTTTRPRGYTSGLSCDWQGTAPRTSSPTASRSRPAPQRVRPSRQARAPRSTRGTAGTDTLDWTALAACESGGDPTAVSSSGRYRGAFQADAAFWRRYGGLAYATRPDLATYAQQLVVAQRGYAVQGRGAWPVCGRRL